jgi:hypothetical protein
MTCAQTRHMTAQLLCVPLPLSLVVVIEMKKVVPHKKGSSIGRVLRFLRMNRRVVPTPTDSYHSHPKELKAALLEAERRKAEALMKWQKRPFIC